MLLVLPPHRENVDSFLKPWWSAERTPPIGILTIASYLRSRGHQVVTLDSRQIIYEYKTNDPSSIILNKIESFSPDIVGINVITANFDSAKYLCQRIRSQFKTPIILGGVHPSVLPQLTLEQIPEADMVCVGAGEEVCLELLDGNKQTPGLYTRNCEFIPSEPLLNIDKYPFPELSEYYTKFSSNNCGGWGFSGASVLTSRGCPYSCNFCGSSWSKPIRYHSPEYVVEFTKHLFNTLPIEFITYLDDTMALNRDRLIKICEGFIHEKIYYPYTTRRWMAGGIRANQADLEILQLMHRAGCFHVGVGVESGCDKSLATLNKKTTVEMNRRACELVKQAKLSLSVSCMMGIPGETEEDARQTTEFLRNLNCNSRGIGTFRPMPGSPFYAEFSQTTDSELKAYLQDWTNLGNLNLPPKYLFCDMDRKTFMRIYDETVNMIYAHQWVTVQDNIYQKDKELVTEIARRRPIRICNGDNYYSTMHIPLKPWSWFNLLEDAAIWMNMHLPYAIQRPLRSFMARLTRVKLLKPFLWRYTDNDVS